MSPRQIPDTTWLVTGGAGGIGAATCRALAADGARVVIHHHRSVEAAQQLAAEIGSERSALVRADLTREAESDALWEDLLRRFGRIDGVVVNAGVWVAEPKPLHEMSLAQWQSTLDADLTSAFLTCRGFLRHLAATPREAAAIVLVGSTAALFGEADHADYASAKAGMVHGLLPSLKNEIVRLAPRGRVNAVCPGWVRTPMASDALQIPGAVDRASRTMALRKIAEPEDVAAAIAFLASPRTAGHLSGVVLPVHGGMEGRTLHE